MASPRHLPGLVTWMAALACFGLDGSKAESAFIVTFLRNVNRAG